MIEQLACKHFSFLQDTDQQSYKGVGNCSCPWRSIAHWWTYPLKTLWADNTSRLSRKRLKLWFSNNTCKPTFCHQLQSPGKRMNGPQRYTKPQNDLLKEIVNLGILKTGFHLDENHEILNSWILELDRLYLHLTSCIVGSWNIYIWNLTPSCWLYLPPNRVSTAVWRGGILKIKRP